MTPPPPPSLKLENHETDCPVVVLLAATKANSGFMNAIKSLQLHGFSYRVIGFGKKWEGWRGRMSWYRDAAVQLAQSNNEKIVVCMDCYDAFSIRHCNPQEFLTLFHSFKKPIVLSLESTCGGNCEPITKWWMGTYGTTHPPKKQYVNGGLVVGRASAVGQMYNWILAQQPEITDDQIGLSRFAIANPDAWMPDIYEQLCTNKTFGETLDFEQQAKRSTYFAHFPGLNPGMGPKKMYNDAAKQILGLEAVQLTGDGDMPPTSQTNSSIVYGVIYGFIALQILILIFLAVFKKL